MMHSLVLKIKRQETPFYAAVYKLIKSLRKINVPSIYVIHRPLYDLSRFFINARWRLQESLWSVPVFKTRCAKYGKNLSLPHGMPWVSGPLRIELGDDVVLINANFISGRVSDEPPVLKIGNRSSVGYESLISVNKRVEIGDDVMIANNCWIADSTAHPIDPDRRRRHECVSEDEVKPIKIGNNVWVGAGCYIMKGVTIGNNSIIGSNTVVTKDVPPNTIVAGGAGRVVKSI